MSAGDPNGSLGSSQVAWLKKMGAALGVAVGASSSPPAGSTSSPQNSSVNGNAHAAATHSDIKRVVAGGGGYVFEQHADGKIFIIQSPKHGNKRIEVTDPKPYQAILRQIGPFPQTPSQPAAASAPTGAKPAQATSLLDQVFGAAGDAADRVSDAVRGVVGEMNESFGAVADRLGFGDGNQASPSQAPGPQTPAQPAKDDTPQILGGADTEVEKKLAEFTKAMSEIVVMVDDKPVSVRPPYFIYAGDRLKKAQANRKKNPKVAKLIDDIFPVNEFSAKATPAQMQEFLQKAVDQGEVTDKSANGLRDFLANYGVSTDCSGLAVQALNFLADGDMVRGDNEAVGITATDDLAKYGEVSAPSNLQAGDMMVKPGKYKTVVDPETKKEKKVKVSFGHVRIVTDVDVDGDAIDFTTLESAGSGGVGELRWRFPSSKKFENLQVPDGDKFKAAGGDNAKYIYTRRK